MPRAHENRPFPETTLFDSSERLKYTSTGSYALPLTLTVFEGGSAIGEVDLREFGKAEVTFGRDETCDIVIPSSIISRRHGTFIIAGPSCMLRDDNSTNGLFLNGARVQQAPFGLGDVARIGDGGASGEPDILFVLDAPGAQWHSYPLFNAVQLTIGRGTSCDIVLPSSSVSALHATLSHSSSGWSIIDNGSFNGTFVNGTIVQGQRMLSPGDTITITTTVMVFSEGMLLYNSDTAGFDIEAIHLSKVVGRKGHEKKITDDVSLSIGKGEFVAIVGGSGAGKSTILNELSGFDPATSGQVLVNGIDLYRNYPVMKNHIGYVPQSDIVYDDLKLIDMLMYAAKLRMPPDSTKQERIKRAHEVIDILELTGREDTYIRSLSGGQKKRASIAVELLADPKLFFLDEPTSGLDPGIERSLMHTLKKMAAGGRTIILVTHNTLNLHLCDKVIFMGTGGKLCYCGDPAGVYSFFGVDNFVDVYNPISEDAQAWHDRFAQSGIGFQRSAPPSGEMPRKRRPSILSQLGTLSARYLHLIFNDRQRLLILLLQAPLLALLIAIVAGDKTFVQYEQTKSVLFALSCASFWVGILDAIQEVCKERVILKREYASGLSLLAYVVSKALVLSLLVALQTVLLIGTFLLVVGQPDESLIQPAFELAMTTFLTAESAMALGLLISAIFRNPDRAMAVAPILLMPQILFSGLVFKLEGASEKISYLVNCRWSMEAYGTTANLNSLDLKIYETIDPSMFEHKYEEFFEYSTAHLMNDWGILLIFTVACLALCWLLLMKTVED